MAKLIDITGKALSGEWGTDDETGNGIPVLRTTNFTNEGIVNYENVVTRIITKKNIQEKFLRPGDIILEKSGGSDKQPVGRVIYYDGPANTYLFNNFTGLLRVREPDVWLARYVFYSLFANYRKGGTREFENKTTGLHNLKTDAYVARFEVADASYSQQIAVCDHLDRLCEIINLRQKQLNLLDDLIKARFVEMFGDCRLNPKGWNTVALGDISEVGSSKRVFVEELKETGIPFYRGTEVGALAEGKAITPELFITPDHYAELVAATGKPAIGDLLMPSICPDGRIWVVDTDEPFYFKDGRVLWVHSIHKEYDPTFLLYTLKDRIMTDYSSIASGTTFAELKIFALKQCKVFDVPLELQKRFTAFIYQIDKSKDAIKKSLTETQTLFDSLMQQYFG